MASPLAPMDPHLRRVFLLEVRQQAALGIKAATLIGESVNSDSERLWLGITALVNASANISKILWPDKKRTRQELIDVLVVEEASPLTDRRLRNHFEHIDHRIEQWWATSSRRNIVDTLVGSRDSVSGIDPGDFFRSYDPETNHVRFQHDAFDLQALVDELERVFSVADRRYFGLP